jgi:hypothetical protein
MIRVASMAGRRGCRDHRPMARRIKVLSVMSAGRRSLATKSERSKSVVKMRRTILLSSKRSLPIGQFLAVQDFDQLINRFDRVPRTSVSR